MSDKNREAWLAKAVRLIQPLMKDVEGAYPEAIHVSVGFPSRRALSAKNRVIGQCWNPSVSADKVPHVFISPVLSDAIQVLETLVHEVIHAVIGTEHQHKGPFVKAMKAVGLEGKPTATHAGDTLRERLNAIAERLGAYPHPQFNAVALQKELDKGKQSTRLLKATCASGDKADGKVYTVRITRVHLDRFGAPICPECLKRMTVDGWEPDDLDDDGGGE